MKSKHLLNLLLSFALLSPVIVSAQEAQQATDRFSGALAPKLSVYEYVGGGNVNRYLQRYDYQKGWSDRGVSGSYLDLDLDLSYSNGKDSLSIERHGYGFYTHSGLARLDSEKVGVSAFYSQYRSASVGLDYRNRPDNVTGGTDAGYNSPANTNDGYVARFIDDSSGAFLRIDRTNYGVGLKSKSGLLRDIPSLSVKHEGYQRTGNAYATWIAGGSDFTGGVVQLKRWRGYDKAINENMGRTSSNFTASPLNWFQLAYDVSFERFENQARDYTMQDFGVTNASKSNPLHYIQDSTLNSHSLRLSKAFKNSSLAVGYGETVLLQDSFSSTQTASNYNKGEIASNNFFISGKCLAVPSLETEVYVKTSNRWNNSTFPAGGLLYPTNGEKLDMRLARIKSMEYGLNATLRPAGSKHSLGAGWKHEIKKRGFNLGAVATGGTISIPLERMLYKADSESDKVFLRGSMRPMDGLAINLTPSYQKAGKVGSLAEAEEALNVKTDASYVTTGGKVLGFYYAYTRSRNNALDYTAMTGTNVNNSMSQDIHSVLHSAGVSMSAAFTAKTNSSVSLDWNQSDFQNYYITSDKRRYKPSPTFLNRGKSKSLIGTTALAVDTDWQVKENLKLTGGYALSSSRGDVASGLIATELASTNDGAVDNYMHVISVGADYACAKDMNIIGRYAFDRYQDNQYSSLSGSGHTLTASVAYKF